MAYSETKPHSKETTMDAFTIAANIIKEMDPVYHQFLEEEKLDDHPITKYGFYTAMLTTIERDPLDDSVTQKLIRLHVLLEMRRAANEINLALNQKVF